MVDPSSEFNTPMKGGGDQEEDDVQQSTAQRKRVHKKKQFILKDDLKKMMFGFGEDPEPREDTLELMELYVNEVMTNVAKRAIEKSQRSGYQSFQVRDLLQVLEQNEKQFLRAGYNLAMQEVMKNDFKKSGKH